MCVLEFGFRLRPAIPGWGVGVCLFVCALCLFPANPGWGTWCICVGWGFGFQPAKSGWAVGGVCVCVRAPTVSPFSWVGCAVWLCVFRLRCTPRFFAGAVGACVLVCAVLRHPANPGWRAGACVAVRALRLYRAILGSGVRYECVCLGLGFGCAPQSLAGMLGCLFLCARSTCTPPIRAGLCGACVGFRFRPSPRQSWFGCWGVSVGAHAPPVPRQSWLGCWGVCVSVRAPPVYRQS